MKHISELEEEELNKSAFSEGDNSFATDSSMQTSLF